MRDDELECVPQWRFCTIPRGQKGPRYANWQSQPRLLDQVEAGNNIGVLLGAPSAGLAALDFDGATAWSWWDQHIGTRIPDTVTWASGKPSRCQMAFAVPEPYWAHLRTVKIATGAAEGFEFRWTGAQSVVPPSLHPTMGAEYFWVQAPSRTDIAAVPDAVLSRWLELSNPAPAHQDPPAYPPTTNVEIEQLAAELKQYYNKLDSYDLWTSVCWAFCNTIGYADGILLMRYYWPEQEPGEYDRLISRPSGGRQYTVGTIKWLIAQRTQRDRDQYLANQAELAELDQISKIIQEKIKNGRQ